VLSGKHQHRKEVRMKTPISKYLAAAVFTVCVGVGPQAKAAWYMSAPATQCSVYGANSASILNLSGALALLNNSTTQDLIVNCPLLDTSSMPIYAADDSGVYINDLSTTRQVCARLCYAYIAGGTNTCSSWVCSGITFTGSTVLSTGRLPTTSGYVAHIDVNLPRSSSGYLYGYVWSDR
jgi:hypothetical protein